VVLELGGVAIVTADHGNADEMYEIDKKSKSFARKGDGSPKAKTSHTLNPVPCHIVGARGVGLAVVEAPGLANVAATVLHLMGYAAPGDWKPSLVSG
jgi:2,3-bisphosphoglycerate-independent phosphoglycerate mutase